MHCIGRYFEETGAQDRNPVYVEIDVVEAFPTWRP